MDDPSILPLFPISRYADYGTGNFYYPYGNTPAEDFLENISPHSIEQPVVLVLGCGDIRSCFYTLWKQFTPSSDPNATPPFYGVHFVLNDHSAAILARNIILLYLCLQKPKESESTAFNKWISGIWGIWFCTKLLPEHEFMLNTAMSELEKFSINKNAWTCDRNPLRQLVQFTDEQTLHKVHCVWRMWNHDKQSVIERYSESPYIRLPFSTSVPSDIQNLVGMAIHKSLSPEEIKVLESEIKKSKEDETTSIFAENVLGCCISSALSVNITMYERPDENYTMDSSVPFRCFFQAYQFTSHQLVKCGYVAESILGNLSVPDKSFKKFPLLANSVQQFALWMTSSATVLTHSTTNSQPDVTFTFNCSDAIEFCHELQSPLHSSKLSTECKFDAVYTSNLVDPISPPNVIFFAMPLLKPNCCLFTQTLKYKLHAETTHKYIEDSFQCDNEMLQVLYGIRCINHEGDQYRNVIAIRPAPVEFNSVCSAFTPYYMKVLIWEKVASMKISSQDSAQEVWQALGTSLSKFLDILTDSEELSSSQTAVKMLKTFAVHVNADVSDAKFWDPLCSILARMKKPLASALQTHCLLSGLHLHLQITDETCPVCNKIPFSEYFGQFSIPIKPITPSDLANTYAHIHKCKSFFRVDPSAACSFDCFAVEQENSKLKLCFIAPLSLAHTGHNVSIVHHCRSEYPDIVKATGALETFLVPTIKYLFTDHELKMPQAQLNQTSLGCLKSHYGNGDTFETVISFSDEAFGVYLSSKRITPHEVSSSKIKLSCGNHSIEITYPYPVMFNNSLSIKISQLKRTVTILANRQCHGFEDEKTFFLVNPDNVLTLPVLRLNEVSLSYLLRTQITRYEQQKFISHQIAHYEEEPLIPDSCPPLLHVKTCISILIRDRETYFTFRDHNETLCAMVKVIKRVYDYQLKVPAVDLVYCVTPKKAIVKKWLNFLVFSEVSNVKHNALELLDKFFFYFSKRTVCSTQSKSIVELEHKVGGSFKRAVVYPLYYDPDHIVENHPLSYKQIQFNPLFSSDHGAEPIKEMFEQFFEDMAISSSSSEKCSYCSKSSHQLKNCSWCHSVQYCNKDCQKKHWKVHKHYCKLKHDGEDESTARCSYCSKTSKHLKTCTGCRAVQYCDQECQRKHWKDHKTRCGIEHQSQSTPCNIQAERSQQQSGKICSFCLKVAEDLKKCKRCYKTQYCDKTCQQQHWKIHKKSCLPN